MINKKELQKMIDMRLHSCIKIRNTLDVTRVPGGWIYTKYSMGANTAVFVPIPFEGRE